MDSQRDGSQGRQQAKCAFLLTSCKVIAPFYLSLLSDNSRTVACDGLFPAPELQAAHCSQAGSWARRTAGAARALCHEWGGEGEEQKMKGRTGSLLPHRDPTQIPNKGGQPGFRFTRATVSWRGTSRLARSALVAVDALLAASTAGPLSGDGKIPADGRGG